jgi:hypothetical protein
VVADRFPAEPDPAVAASGITHADSTAKTGISTDRRIATPLFRTIAPTCHKTG